MKKEVLFIIVFIVLISGCDIPQEPESYEEAPIQIPEQPIEEHTNEPNPLEQQDEEQQEEIQGCETNPQPVFTHAFAEHAMIKNINPIGAISGGSHGRSYVDLNARTEVYAPIDSELIAIDFSDRGSGFGEFGLVLRASCEVTYILDHIDDVVDKIKEIAPPEFTEESIYVSMPIKAGELLGNTDGGGRRGPTNFDFLVINKAKRVQYINQDRWSWEQNTYADCPYDYYTGELKSFYYSKLSPFDCGSPSYDVEGTISGAWFQGNGTDYDRWLTIGKDQNYIGVTIREGTGIVFFVREWDQKPPPDEVTEGESICYDDEEEWVYLKLDQNLYFASGEGNCPSSFPEEAEVWVR